MKVAFLFVVLAAAFGLWHVTSKRDRKAVKSSARRFAVPVLLAALATLGLLAFAFIFNGKLI